MSDKDVSLSIGADDAGMVAGLKKAEDAVKSSAQNMQNAMSSVAGAFGKVHGAFLALTALVAGGAAFKAAINASTEWAGEAGKLSKALGITTEKASVMMVALNHIGVGSDVVVNAAQKMSKQIFTNSDAFEKLGVKVRDTAGNYRPITDVMAEVNQKLLDIKNPIEQNIAGQQAYGRSWAEVRPLLKLTAETMEEARKRAEELHLVVGPQGEAMAKQYKAQLRDLNLVGKSLEIQFGNQLMPVFTKLGAWMGQEAPAMGQVFKSILLTIVAAAQTLWEALNSLGSALAGLGAIVAAALKGDFGAVKGIYADMEAENKRRADNIRNIWANAYKMPEAKASKNPDLSAGLHPDFAKDGGGDKSRMQGWETALAEKKLVIQEEAQAENSFREMSKAEELRYWQEILARRDLSEQESVALRRKAADLSIAIRKDEFEKELAALRTQEAEWQKNADKKLAIATKEAALVAQKYGVESKEYELAQKHIVEVTQQAAEQRRQIAQTLANTRRQLELAEVDAEESDAQMRVDLGIETHAQLLQEEQSFENRRHQIRLDALNASRALIDPERDPVAFAQISSQIEEAEQQHQLKLRAIRNRAVVEANKDWTGMFQTMQGGFQQVITNFLKGSATIGQTIKGLFSSVVEAMIGMIAQIAARWLAQQAMQLLGLKTTGIATISEKAAEAGAGGVASMAAAPWPLNMSAPAFGAAMSAAALGFSSMLAAEHGFDVPAGVNPITQLHQKEMVLPADIAEPMRQSLAGGGGLGGPVIQIQAVDAASVRRLFEDHGSALVAALKRQARGFAGA